MGSSSSKKKDENKKQLEIRNELLAQEKSRAGTSSRSYDPGIVQAAKIMPPVTFTKAKEEPRVGSVTSVVVNSPITNLTVIQRHTDKEVSHNLKLPQREETDQWNIPKKHLNEFGFINYNHHGLLPWSSAEDVNISIDYMSKTNFLGIDCEMVGVGHLKSSALGRVSIVNEYGFCVYDEFVMPKEEITDYRTEFSGIRPEDLVNAYSIDRVLSEVKIVIGKRVLVGHSIHNDLEVLELNDYPPNLIRDTSLYYKSLMGTKSTPSLKVLTCTHLGVRIQGGEHSSIQDAQATIKLYLLRQIEWEKSLTEWREKVNLTNLNSSQQFMTPPVDITKMNVCPRETDIFADSKTVFIRENKILGSYSSSEEYLDVHFRLLREDLYRPLRQKVIEASLNRCSKRTGTTPKPGTIYNSVRILENNAEVRGKKTLVIPCSKNNLRSVDWADSNLFMTGSLLLLTPNNFKSVKFAIVAWRTDENKERNVLHLNVNFVNDGPSWITKEGDNFKMMESVAFYETYRHTLQYFQVMKFDSFPLKKYIVDVVMEPSLPKYLKNADVLFDFSIFKKNNVTCSKIKNFKSRMGDFNNWPTANQLNFDDSQYEAFQKAITQEFTIIQGPPGTGKTFIALQVVKFLLSNPRLLNSPILIVSYTNHALDQMLETILHFVTEEMCNGNEFKAHNRILRLGGGCKSEILEPLCLRSKSDKKHKKQGPEELLRAIKNVDDFEKISKEGVIDLCQLDPDIIEQLSLKHKDIWELWMNAIETIENDPSKWFNASTKKVSATMKTEKNSMILLPFSDLKTDIVSRFLDVEKQVNALVPTESKEFIQNQVSIALQGRAQQGTYSARWIIYAFLVVKVKEIGQEMVNKIKKFGEALEELQRVKNNKFSKSLLKIVGMTTTGAVKYKKMVVSAFKSQVMIVEEAAHVLEAHIVASLTEHCQQMIMIGDHQQLRPMAADNNIGKNYNLEISLMERLVDNGKSQGVKNWVQLKVQHRMRAEIAEMICPVIYENLENHPDVNEYPKVKGCRKNLFFINHSMDEKQDNQSSSFINDYEASFLSNLCQYFIKEKYYDPSQITIIATYLDQKMLLEKKLLNLRGCSDVRISTVDGYQGEENDIILLSLVRSNSRNVVGFLKTDNRVCVALSRARHGLFMIGNMSCLNNSSATWRKINNILIKNKSIGRALEVICPTHGCTARVFNAQDFNKISCPGCVNQRMRKDILDETIDKNRDLSQLQSHQHFQVPKNSIIFQCKNNAFIQSESEIPTRSLFSEIQTPIVASNLIQSESQIPIRSLFSEIQTPIVASKLIQSENQIPIRSLFSEIQTPIVASKLVQSESKIPIRSLFSEIQTPIVASKLSCGHTTYLDKIQLNVAEIKCIEVLVKQLPCGHILKFPCYQNVGNILCSKIVEKILPCGHKYPVKTSCSLDMSNLKCIVPVPKLLPCGHQLNAHCHMEASKINCNVQVPGCTQHGKVVCYKRSSINCYNVVTRLLLCGHFGTVPCSKQLSEIKCITQLSKSFPCGHQKAFHCHQEKLIIQCDKRVELCEHLGTVPCHQLLETTCIETVKKVLQCGHEIEISCFKRSSEIKCVLVVPKKYVCGHIQKYPCHLLSSHSKCGQLVTKLLPCGHEYKNKIHCHQSVPPVKCRVPVRVQLPLCKHEVVVKCHDKERTISPIFVCQSDCKKKFKCGHSCPLSCHVNSNLNHEQIMCLEKCHRFCPKGHRCPGDHLCHTNCKFRSMCTVKCTDRLQCGHYHHFLCHEYGTATASRDKPCEICDVNRVCDSTLKSLSTLNI